ncbi:hypothetical protein HKD37_16G045828 [Glycine soja]
MRDGEDDSSKVIFNRVLWVFKPCIKDYQYCKSIVQVDDTFLTRKYCDTLLISIAQDGNRNISPLAFAIVKSGSKELWTWFLHYLRRYVTPQPNLCIISDRGTSLLATLRSERVRWIGSCVTFTYYIYHIASNFNKEFKNVDLKKTTTYWLDQIPKSKWTQANDEGKCYGHMTTNIVECMNSILKEA